MELVYDFTVEGRVQGMHSDDFNLSFLGAQKIQRASDIRFDESSQTWGIWLADAQGGFIAPLMPLAGFVGYNEARDFEVAALNSCRKEGIDPLSEDGNLHMLALRRWRDTSHGKA